MPLADQIIMTATGQLGRYARKRMIRRMTRAVPWIGGAVALMTLGGAIRRKGWVGGTLDTVLDVVPFVGTAKNLAEVRRGRDFIPEKRLVIPEERLVVPR
jgi:hypothetical protein